MTAEIKIQKNVLSKNDEIAAQLRRTFAERRIFVVNILSSPGSGKTTLLEKTAQALGSKLRLAAIEGDLQTSRDADRIAGHGVKAVQINTGRGCHLDANMVTNV
ncbi:MAG TPA: hydrogenase nickel incorporation protein HypB, partial [Planctomycetota bacterium]|nr:hydrogenase nickel incorporation protein HypB [Planctomycetota bacterium]